MLLKRKKNYTGIKLSSAKAISNAWIKRWLLNRIKRKDTIEKLKNLNAETIRKNLFFPEIIADKKDTNQILMFPEN